MAASCDLLDVDPLELRFPFELDKQISCPLKMTNKTESTVAFKVKTTSPKKYCVRPNNGVVQPQSTCVVIVTMQAQTVAPPDLQCKDRFLVQSVVVGDGLSAKNITPQMVMVVQGFMKEEGNVVEEVKLRVTYVMPSEPPSEIAEEIDGPQRILVPMQRIVDNGRSDSELSSGSVSLRSAELGTDSGSPIGQVMRTEQFLKAAEPAIETRKRAGPDEQSLKLSDLTAKLTKEKNSALEQNRKLRNELDAMVKDSKFEYLKDAYVHPVFQKNDMYELVAMDEEEKNPLVATEHQSRMNTPVDSKFNSSTGTNKGEFSRMRPT